MAIMILGAGIMQLPAYQAAQRKGWKTIAADGNPEALCCSMADLFLPVDLKDRVGLVSALQEASIPWDLKGVFTCGTDFSASVAWVAEKMGLPGIPWQRALDCSDKFRMRRRFAEHHVPSPAFREFSEGMDLDNTLHGLSFPLVIKPVDNMGSRGVITAANRDEAEKALAGAIACSRTDRAIMEEFMEGPEYSIDALVFDNEIHITGFADRHIFYPPCFIEMGHTLPSLMAGQEREELFRVFKKGVRALGITLGAAKGDVKMTPRGPMIGEIAARLSGGYMSGWTYPYASGVPLVEKAMALAMGLGVENLEETEHNTASERAFISIPGKIREIRNVESAHNLPHIQDLFLMVAEGDEVAFPRNNVSKCGNVIALSYSREEALQASEAAVSTIRIDLEQDQPSTLHFLSRPLDTVFPPSAYRAAGWESERELLDFHPDFTMKYVEHPLPVPPENSDFLKQKDWNRVLLSQALKDCAAKGLIPARDQEGTWSLFARHFWHALLRGGVQGALYFLERNHEDS